MERCKVWNIANIIILLVAVPAYADNYFNRMVKKEVVDLLSRPATTTTIMTNEMSDSLPPIVKKWLRKSGVIGKDKFQFVRLKQKGELRTNKGVNGCHLRLHNISP